jgi:hypothetical protein
LKPVVGWHLDVGTALSTLLVGTISAVILSFIVFIPFCIISYKICTIVGKPRDLEILVDPHDCQCYGDETEPLLAPIASSSVSSEEGRVDDCVEASSSCHWH